MWIPCFMLCQPELKVLKFRNTAFLNTTYMKKQILNTRLKLKLKFFTKRNAGQFLPKSLGVLQETEEGNIYCPWTDIWLEAL